MIEITHLTLADAADWQVAVVTECRRRKALTPALANWLERVGLLSRCSFLSSSGPGEPLSLFRPGRSASPVSGRPWGEGGLEPDGAETAAVTPDPLVAFARDVGAEYAESVGPGETAFSRVIVSGVGRPFVYTHALYGWEDRGRRMVLSAVDIQTLH
ncbi:hypothetical protein [Azospirillum agricola]|uniref:hypothetical protein n=1 Tax=Azospirillum agricola TaxID=1720247 RepID=UPI000A1CC184|nr:hypothetical protein [Azospirillum agricola]